MTVSESTAQASLRTVLSRSWPELTQLRSASPRTLWKDLQDEGSAAATSLTVLVEMQRALGAVAAPAPVADLWAADNLLGGDLDFLPEGCAIALVAAATVQDGFVNAVEFGDIVSHLVVADPGTGAVSVHAVAGVVETPGSAVPAWSRVRLGVVVREMRRDPASVVAVLARMRFALAARTFAAAEATHLMAIQHAKTRVQFGRAIGSYQAVQHRTVDCAIEVAMARALIDDALRLEEAGDATVDLAMAMAVEHTLDRASWVQFEAHHTLAASGFFDLYPAPWIFRRVHADLARIPLLGGDMGGVADSIFASGVAFPNSDLGVEAESLRSELRELFERLQPQRGSGRQAETNPELVDELKHRGLLTASWPAEFGGRSASVETSLVLSEEVALRRIGVTTAVVASSLIGNAIIRFGTATQQAKFLPLIADANLEFYLGYSEPEVGSDLASVQLTAVRDGADWILNGTKRWGQAQRARWGWVAARTNPDVQPRHAGISVFLFDLQDLPGFSVEEITSLAGETHAFSHYDNVRIPGESLIGELDGGWKIITSALAEERITMAGQAMGSLGLLQLLIEELERGPGLPSAGSAGRQRLGRVATRLQATRVLTSRSAVAQAHPGERGAGALEAPLAKIAAGEATEEFSKLAIDLLGPGALLDKDAVGSIGQGLFDYSLRICLIGTVGGGTGDIQRNIIARALGLPKG